MCSSSSANGNMKLYQVDIVLVAVVAVAVLAAIFQFNGWLVAISIIAAVIIHVVSSGKQTRAAQIDYTKRQIDELYAPWAKVAAALS